MGLTEFVGIDPLKKFPVAHTATFEKYYPAF